MDTNSQNIQTACNMAVDLVELQMGKHMVWEDRADGSEGLTEDAQDLFNEIYGAIMVHLEKHER